MASQQVPSLILEWVLDGGEAPSLSLISPHKPFALYEPTQTLCESTQTFWLNHEGLSAVVVNQELPKYVSSSALILSGKQYVGPLLCSPTEDSLLRTINLLKQQGRYGHVYAAIEPLSQSIIDTLKRESTLYNALRHVKKLSPQTQELYRVLTSIARRPFHWEQNLSKVLEHRATAGSTPPNSVHSSPKTPQRFSNGPGASQARLRCELGGSRQVVKAERFSARILDHNAGYDQFDWDVYLFHPQGEAIGLKHPHKIQAVACLDTQCRVNWISYKSIRRLGMEEEINTIFMPPDIADYNGHAVEAIGTIQICWRECLGKETYGPVELFVSKISAIDLIFGSKYIVAENLLIPNRSRDRMLPLVQHRKPKLSEKAEQALLEEQQKQEKAKAEAFRRQISQSSSSSSSSGDAISHNDSDYQRKPPRR